MSGIRSLLLPSLLVVFVSVSFFRLGSVTLFDVDEAVFSQATKEMVLSGDWITPTYNGVNRYDKPILFYWLMAGSYKIFGINEFAARFPSAVAGMLLCGAMFLFISQVVGRERAIHASLSLVSSIYFFVYSHSAVTDMVLTLFITLSIFSFFISISKSGRPAITDWGLMGFYLFSALAFLTKGLIGIIFPFSIAVIYLIISGGITEARRALSIKGIILFLAVSGPWYVAEFAVNGTEFIQQFFIKHHFMRYTGVISGHNGPFYYYIPVLIIGLLPWITFLPAGIRNALKATRFTRLPLLQTRNRQEGIPLPVLSGHSPDLLAMIWLFLIVIFFSCSTTKLPNYILTAVPAASILISSGMSELNTRSRRYSHILMALISFLAGIAFLLSPVYLLKAGILNTGWTLPAAFIMSVITVMAVYTVMTGKTLYPYITALMFAFILVLSTSVLPLANEKLQGALHRFGLFAKQELRADEPLITYRINAPSLAFYSDRRIVNIGGIDDLAPLLSRNGRLLVIAKANEINQLTGSGFLVVDKDEKYALLERQ